ncbi:hypothetical protein SAMN04488011_101829 [Palleronia pelagia]|uniref:Uncharacterized protein n=1 Tax=Palleronia pelagia TaxID=387096 RepID=A0A1H8C1A9_9RHOB|nr:hypothetical protein SAMN04488011_101829 [Palleronia pelagia]
MSRGRMMPKAPRLEFPRTFSPEWKSVCLEILEDYRASKATSLGKSVYGWQAVRDDIMRAYDDHGARTKSIGRRDDLLSVGDMNSYARSGSLGPEKFGYVESFIKEMAPSRDLSASIIKIKQRADAQKLASFQDIYQRQHIDPQFVNGFAGLLGQYIYSEPLPHPFAYRQIFARIDFIYLNCLKLTWAYSKKLCDEGDFRSTDLVFLDGFLIPLPDPKGRYNSGVPGINVDGFDCLLKLFRPQLGDAREEGHIDAKLRCFISRPNKNSNTRLDIHVAASHQPMTPSGVNLGLPHRMIHITNSNTGTFELNCDQNRNDKIANIFDNWYKGYVF